MQSPEEKLLAREIEKEENNRLKNKPVIVITYFMMAVFMCLIGYIIYFMQFQAETTIANSRNVRQDSFADTVERGEIVTSDGEVIANSTTDEEGNTTRHYPHANMFAHTVGYDSYGKSGLELAGNFYMLRSHVNIFEQVTKQMAGEKNRGDTLVTTLNYKLQSAAYEALGSAKGAVVVMETSTGKILAMVSKPDFDANDMDGLWEYLQTEEGSKSTLLLNRATQGLYAPGSTFKVVTLLEYMREHPADHDDYSYTCDGIDDFANIEIHCYNSMSHGQETLKDSLAYSCNCSFANIGMTLDRESYRKTAEALLLNKPLPYDGVYSKSSFEISGSSDDIEMPQTVIGQGNTQITPLNNVLIMAAIANGGELMRPYLIDHIESAGGMTVKTFKPKAYGECMTSAEAAELTEYMRAVADYGTAAAYFNGTPYDVVGKTGTAEYDNEGNCNSWFVGFSHPEDPDIAVAVVVEDTDQVGITGTDVAKRIFDVYYSEN